MAMKGKDVEEPIARQVTCNSTLSGESTDALHTYHVNKARQYHEGSSDKDRHKTHACRTKPHSIVSAMISGVINWLLMFGLCCAYGMILFSSEWHVQHRALGVKMNLATAFFVGLALSLMSGIPVAIGGPDLNPVVFLGGFVELIGQTIADELGLEHPDNDNHRRLGDGGTSSGTSFCLGQHLGENLDACAEYHERLRATVIFATAASSLTLGLCFFCIGHFKLTRLASYLPQSIVEAFLSCVGYKVFKYALKFCNYDPLQFVPAACAGVFMYLLKAMHIGNPAVTIPLMLVVPLAVYYAIVFGSGSDLAEARNNDYMFPEMPDVGFWMLWAESWGKFGKINMAAWVKTLPDLATMLIVCILDCLLKLVGTENKLSIKVDKDYEVKLYGLCNFMTFGCGSSVGYNQLKFNVINSGVMGNATDQRGGIIYALLCGVGFFGTIALFNLQPRFFLSLLLFFAGTGFVAENLWGSRRYMNFREWMQVFIILGVFALTEKLLYAVVVGGLLTCFDFVGTYSTVPCVLGQPMRGGELATAERYDAVLQKTIQHVMNSWCLVIRLKGFIFFGSAQCITRYVNLEIHTQRDLPQYAHLKFVVFDCKLLDGIDASASKAIENAAKEMQAVGVRLLWSNVNHDLVTELKMRDVLAEDTDWFCDLNEAVLYVQGEVLQFLSITQERWDVLHPAFALYRELAHMQSEVDPFANILSMDTMRHGCPWRFCKRVTLEQHKTLLWEPGKMGAGLFLVHTGAVALYKTLPRHGSSESMAPIAIYRRGWFLNRGMLASARTHYYAVALENGEALCWNERQWFNMAYECPYMSSAISKAAMRQQRYDWQLMKMQAEQKLQGVPTADLGSSGAVSVSGQGDECSFVNDTSILEEIQDDMDRLHTAQVLENFGLFAQSQQSPLPKSNGDTQPSAMLQTASLPEMPDHFVHDLMIAFQTYSVQDCNSCPHLPSDLIAEALLFAGIAKVVMTTGASAMVNLSEFLVIAQNAIMARFSHVQIISIEKVFKGYDVDQSGALDRGELEEVLQETFRPWISIEEVAGICSFWDADRSGKIEVEEFCQLISRFVRQHEQEWSLLCAFKDLVGAERVDLNDILTAKQICKTSSMPITEMEAEEMCWVADWRNGGRTTTARQGIELKDVLPALLLQPGLQSARMPPELRGVAASECKMDLGPSGVETSRESFNDVIPHERDMRWEEAVVDLRQTIARQRTFEEVMRRLGERARSQEGNRRSLLNLHPSSSFVSPSPHLQLESSQQSAMRVRMYHFLNTPDSSMAAQVWFATMLLFVLLSLLTLVFQEVLAFVPDRLWYALEVGFTTLFTLELLLRACVANAVKPESVSGFCSNMGNICDFLAVLPFYLELVLHTDDDELQLLRINRFVRVTRAFKFVRMLQVHSSFGGAIITVLAVIWGIYLKNRDSDY